MLLSKGYVSVLSVDVVEEAMAELTQRVTSVSPSLQFQVRGEERCGLGTVSPAAARQLHSPSPPADRPHAASGRAPVGR
jgi:hypothetical protein